MHFPSSPLPSCALSIVRVHTLIAIGYTHYLYFALQGVHPLTAFGVDSPTTSLLTTPAQSTRDEGESFGLGDDFEEDFVNEIETRLVMSCMCTIRTKLDSPVASVRETSFLLSLSQWAMKVR